MKVEMENELETSDEVSIKRLEVIRNETQCTVSLTELFFATLPLGFITFGGPIAHIAVLEREFVQKRRWISNEQFAELIALGQSLPGPTSTQMVIAMGTLSTNSLLGGIVSFACFSTPSFIVLVISGFLLKDQKVTMEFPNWLQHLVNGFCCAAVSLVAQAAWKLSRRVATTKFTQTLLIAAASAQLILGKAIYMVILMVIGGALSLFVPIEPSKESDEEGQEKKSTVANTTDSIPFLGWTSLILFIGILGFSWVLKTLFPWKVFIYFFSFYKIGSLIFGGGHVVLPMILSEFSEYGYLTEVQFLNGFAIVSALPGPMFNLSAYIGVVIDNLPGAFLCTVAMFLPAFLTIWGFLPLWRKFRERESIRKILRGVSATAVGFVLVALFLLWQTSGENFAAQATCITLISFCLLELWALPAPLVLLIGGILRILLS